MVDTTLVLLCLFLVAQPLSHAGRPGSAARRPAPALDLQLILELRSDGSDRLNHQPVPRNELGSLLRRLFQSRPDRPLFLQVDPDRPYGDVLEARAIAYAAGARVVALTP